MLARADAEIALLQSINAQGVVFWDIEGNEFQSVTYIGDARKLALLAPEMDACADEFIGKFRAAGLRVGITIRPQTFGCGTTLPDSPTVGQVFLKVDAPYGQRQFTCLTNGTWVQQAVNQQKVEDSFYPDLADKVAYCKSRWGASLFYIDSYGTNTDYKTESLVNLSTANPDCLFMPEYTHASMTNYFSVCAPWYPGQSGYLVPAAAKTIYPLAWMAIYVTSIYSDTNAMISALRNGNLFLVNSWYANAGLTNVQQVYQFASTNKFYHADRLVLTQ